MATGRDNQGAGERTTLILVGLVATIVTVATIVWLTWDSGADGHDGVPGAHASLAERTGSVFLPPPSDFSTPPSVERLTLPAVPGGQAIWGATGRDRSGRIWFGVSVAGSRSRTSAHLLRYDPVSRSWASKGSVLEQLRLAGLYREGIGQVKIHSKIVPADDGFLYFASSDEEGENADGSVPPRWGGHLWRMRPGDEHWEHVMAAPEGLVAAGAAGRYVYVLGYWGHVLYQFDTLTSSSRKVVVGSIDGHVSRNFLSSVDGHAFVPRLRREPGGGVTATLVQFDEQLREVASTPLEFYLGKGSPGGNHGITGLATLPDGRIAFTTALGYLYLVEPTAGAPAGIQPVGWFHPGGRAYAPSLFAYGGGSLLAGVTQHGNRFDWVVYELSTRVSTAQVLDTSQLGGALLYGSMARDDAGGSYLVGWAEASLGSPVPLALRVTPAP